jgi:hypothetical protein
VPGSNHGTQTHVVRCRVGRVAIGRTAAFGASCRLWRCADAAGRTAALRFATIRDDSTGLRVAFQTCPSTTMHSNVRPILLTPQGLLAIVRAVTDPDEIAAELPFGASAHVIIARPQ